MEVATSMYSVHPVAFDADIVCEYCDQPATHLMSTPSIDGGGTRHEVCEACVHILIAKFPVPTQWALFDE